MRPSTLPLTPPHLPPLLLLLLLLSPLIVTPSRASCTSSATACSRQLWGFVYREYPDVPESIVVLTTLPCVAIRPLSQSWWTSPKEFKVQFVASSSLGAYVASYDDLSVPLVLDSSGNIVMRGSDVNAVTRCVSGYMWSDASSSCVPLTTTCASVNGQSNECEIVSLASSTDAFVSLFGNGSPDFARVGGVCTPTVNVVAGGTSTCATLADGEIQCWGANSIGQLGVGDNVNRQIPTTITALGDATTLLTLGSFHACGLVDGVLKCWGANTYGELGVGDTTNYASPVAVNIADGAVTQLALGDFSSCALTNTNNVWCWGRGFDGELGTGDTTSQKLPVRVTTLDGLVSQIASGLTHVCAVLTNETLVCWGQNVNGALGVNDTVNRLTPTAVSFLEGSVAQISLGYESSCVILTTGVLKCWGLNFNSQLGLGDTADRWVPTTVSSIAPGSLMQIALANGHSCGLLVNGTVLCWGTGGALGLGDSAQRSLPTAVTAMAGTVSRIAIAQTHGCAVLTSGALQCWGDGSNGQLGLNDTATRLSPATVIDVGGTPTRVVVGGFHSCLLLSNNGLECWGLNGEYELGTGDSTDRYSPTLITAVNQIAQVALGSRYTCVVAINGTLACWGSNMGGQLGTGDSGYRPYPTAVGVSGIPTQLALGTYHSCAIITGGTLECWGYNFGNLGTNDTVSHFLPTNVTLIGGQVRQVACGYSHTCVVLTTRTLQCWGSSTQGAIGVGDSSAHTAPVTVSQVEGPVASVVAGTDFTCVLLTTASVQCWGVNNFGQLGVNDTNNRLSPANFSLLAGPASQLAAGVLHACALLTSGVVQCWGYNSDGQLGVGDTAQRIVPTTVTLLGGVASAIAAGGDGSCAMLQNGAIQCWGYNFNGQVGAGDVASPKTIPTFVLRNTLFVDSTSPTLSPTRSPTLKPTRSPTRTIGFRVSLGTGFTCVSMDDGELECAGKSDYGQTGLGISKYTPVTLSGFGNGVSSVSGGSTHSCATATNGTLWCWGSNGNGQLGLGDTTQRILPAFVSSLENSVSQVALGVFYTCAIATNGTLWCWGYNNHGQLGLGDTIQRLTPTYVSSLGNSVSQVTIGDSHTCAIMTNGTLWCWGNNGNGQLGSGDTTQRLTPTYVSSLGNSVAQVALGDAHTCAIATNGTLWCWGYNNNGQLGLGDTTQRLTPTYVSSLGNTISQVAAGYYHTCANAVSGTLWCWGFNFYGQLGLGNTTRQLTPTYVSSLGDSVSQVALGDSHACVMMTNGTLWCWGDNQNGQLGLGDSSDRYTPTYVSPLGNAVSQVAAGSYHTCAITTTAALSCWGNSDSGELGWAVSSLTQLSVLSEGVGQFSSGGFQHACAILTNATLWCWGYNFNGQLGLGNTIDMHIPTYVFSLGNSVSQVALGYFHTCAIMTNGTLWCWGHNSNGQLGLGNTTDTHIPAYVSSLENSVSQLALGYDHTCAIATNGTLWCWGYSLYGQLGLGDTTQRLIPTYVSSLEDSVSQITLGDSHTCAIATNGTLWCWGNNGNGQLGLGDTTQRLTPTYVSSLGNSVSQVAAGHFHTCAVMTDGTLWCWGLNGDGELGLGDSTNRLTPNYVSSLGDSVSQVALGDLHTCAIATNATLWCWGNNGYGQLALGDVVSRNLPTLVTKDVTWSPTTSPSSSPTRLPTTSPTRFPSSSPTIQPTSSPTLLPTSSPTLRPTNSPTLQPSTSPTLRPTFHPTTSPTRSPTRFPTTSPTHHPSSSPTLHPTSGPTLHPTLAPTHSPVFKPTVSPTLPLSEFLPETERNAWRSFCKNATSGTNEANHKCTNLCDDPCACASPDNTTLVVCSSEVNTRRALLSGLPSADNEVHITTIILRDDGLGGDFDVDALRALPDLTYVDLTGNPNLHLASSETCLDLPVCNNAGVRCAFDSSNIPEVCPSTSPTSGDIQVSAVIAMTVGVVVGVGLTLV